ncbi:MAG: sensor histidine kinase, partial [Candidatus Methylomirabilales bacterium]
PMHKPPPAHSEGQAGNRLAREVVRLLRLEADNMRHAWTTEMSRRGLSKHLTAEEAEAEWARLYEALIECLETGRYHSAQTYAEEMAERDVFRGIGAKQVIGRLLVLRDVCGRLLCHACPAASKGELCGLDVYEAVVNRMLTIVAMAFLQERERAVGRGREQLAALVEAGMVLAAERSLETLLQRIVELACRLLQARYGALATLDAAGKLERFVTTGVPEEQKQRIPRPPIGQGILGLVTRERRPVRLRDLQEDARAFGFPPGHPPMRSFLGVPIMSRGRAFGNLYVTEKQGAEEFSKEDEQLATTLAAQAAIAIENASLYEQLQRSYDDLKQSQDLLVRQEKLASLGRLAAGVAHELNNPLSSVAGFAEALQRRTAELGQARGCGIAECQEYLPLIQSEVARAATIVRRLLDYARQREPTHEPVDVTRVAREAVAFVERQARLANQEIRVTAPEAACQVVGDAAMLQQVFLNLLTNALDAVEGGGQVDILVRCEPDGAGGPGWVEVLVRDTGIGIPPETLRRVFDPFFTTKEVGKGTGLGLAISQSIVEQHGGTIELTSPGRGRGATVRVRLPRIAREAR